MSPPRHNLRRASALVICLLILVLISALLIGFVTTARVEVTTSRATVAGYEASLFADMAVDTVRARLQRYANRDYFWISQPGRLMAQKLPISGETPGTPEEIPLFSGMATEEVKDVSVNLNPQGFVSGAGLIAWDVDEVMAVTWKYVRRDGTIHDALPPFDKDNPVVGRYAFWTDDNSAQINWNTAWSRGAANISASSHPSRIDLTAINGLTAAEADVVETYRKNESFFPTSQSVRAIGNEQLSQIALEENFLFTPYSHAPELTVFGTERICLTTKQDRAGDGRRYLSILKDESADPGLLSNVDLNKLNQVFTEISDVLRRNDWPGADGLSFLQKYGEAACAQLALNIIEYVRSVESDLDIVEPIPMTLTGSISAGNARISKLWPDLDHEWQYLGNTRSPRITEMGVHVNPTPDAAGNYACTLLVEIYNPAGSGRSMNLSAIRLYHSTALIYHFGHPQFYSTETGIGTDQIIDAGEYSEPLMLKPGETRVLRVTAHIDKDTHHDVPPPRKFFLKAGLFNSSGVMLDFAPYTYSPHLEYMAVPGGGLLDIESRSVEDPFVNRAKSSWKETGPNSWKQIPLPSPVSVIPEQDTTANGSAIDPASVFQSMGPSSGLVHSVAELGRIHTGLQGTFGAGVPWRSLRLQPRVASDATLPDWLLLDAFRAPLVTSSVREKGVLEPNEGAVSGRINLNQAMKPFSDLPPRRPVLEAWAKGSGVEPSTGAISTQTAATGTKKGRFFTDPSFTDEGLFTTVGQIAEVEGVSSSGETSESNLLGALDLATVRSNTFTVYAIGQSLRQTVNGVFIQGERRTQTLVERLEDGSSRIVQERNLGL